MISLCLSLFPSIGSWDIIGYCFPCKLQRWLCWQLLSCLWVHSRVNLLMGSLHFELSCCEFNRAPSWAIWCTIESTYLTGADHDFMISMLLLNHGTYKSKLLLTYNCTALSFHNADDAKDGRGKKIIVLVDNCFTLLRGTLQTRLQDSEISDGKMFKEKHHDWAKSIPFTFCYSVNKKSWFRKVDSFSHFAKYVNVLISLLLVFKYVICLAFYVSTSNLPQNE